jgi:dipeptidyl-peptidase III
MASISSEATTKLNGIIDLMMAAQPAGLGYPNENNQSAYYPGDKPLTKEEIKAITKMMEVKRIAPENTRLQKRTKKESSEHDHIDDFEILQASAEMDATPEFLGNVEIKNQPAAKVFLRRGDHSKEMTKICAELESASKYATNKQQKAALSQLAGSFRTGDYQAFLDAQKTWINDKAPRVEHCMGFLFGYRDPDGVRAEWQAAAGVANSKETSNMNQLVKKSPQFIRALPWAVSGENDGKGPFEPSELTVPDFAIIHGEHTKIRIPKNKCLNLMNI